jgi:hypothetical protein
MRGLLVAGSSALLWLVACDVTQDLGNPADDGGSEASKHDGDASTDGGPLRDGGTDATADSTSDGQPSSDGGDGGSDSPSEADASDADASDADASGGDGGPTDCPTTEGTQGTVLASGQPATLRGLSVDSANVYWSSLSSSGVVAMVAKGGGTPVTLASDQVDVWDVLSDGTSVYWPSSNASLSTSMISTLPVSGGTPTTFWTVSSPAAGAFDLATDGVNLYWAPLQIMSEPLTGGTAYDYEPAGPEIPGPFVAVDASNVYWISGNTFPLWNEVISISKGGGSASMVWSNTSSATLLDAIAADSTGLYWVDQGSSPDSGSIYTIPSGGGGVTQLVTGLDYPEGIAIDGTNVYWADQTGISKMPIGGGATTVLASGEQGAVNVKVDDTDVYWVNSCFGTVKKIAK